MPEDTTPTAIDLLQQVCDIMEDRELAEVYLHEGEVTLRVRRDNEPVRESYPNRPNGTAGTATEQTPSLLAQLPQKIGELIRSPMPGTFYRSPSPEEPHYVEVGSVVTETDTLCLIEAMKIFNTVEAGFPCEIIEMLVENGTAVEFDQPLFRVKRA
ncbi:MAG: acetyl-CoA carboxylase biotin carboxyl carrier protein [Candidatus Poribacteria bacterium]|nr:acetyl-CoA carboxylase biotin carboxyl carrier protein [Candidatus Poribacteria bacterium]